jgi:spore maturation protein CgeB
MRIFVITADYPAFLEWFYSSAEGVAKKTYSELLRLRHESLFGVAGYYSSNLRKLGHEAWDVRANDEIMQMAWGRENGIVSGENSGIQKRSRTVLNTLRPIVAKAPFHHLKTVMRPMVRRITGNATYDILKAQIKHYKPDVILNQAMDIVPDEFFVETKPYARLTVGQIAAPLPAERRFRGYDLVFSSLPNYVDYFRQQGLASELSRLAFEPSILPALGPATPRYGATFVGSLSTFHSGRIELLDSLCRSSNLQVWGELFGSLPRKSAIPACHHGRAWGIEMFRILRDSRITINHHIGIAKNYANNMRLYEATGAGTLLLTDAKDNLNEIFTVDQEVVTYHTVEECREKVDYYLGHESERARIANAGQQRTLKEHTYENRMQEIADVLELHLSRRSAAVVQI